MIILILTISLILRLVNLNQSLWLDEAVQAVTAQNSFSYIFTEITGDFHPPLYYFLMHFWVRIFGSSEIALRIPSVLFGVGTVLVLYKLTMHVHSRFVAILAAVFLATAPFHIYYSQEARMYSITTFLATLSMFYFLKIILVFNGSFQTESVKLKTESEKRKLKTKNFNFDVLFYFLSTVGLIYSDYYGFLVLLAQALFLLIQKKYKFLLIANCLLLIVYLPWIPMFAKQIQTGIQATQILPGWGKLVNVSFVKAIPLTLIKFVIGRITIFNKTIYGLVSFGILGMLGVLGSNFYKFYKCYKKENKSFFTLILLWFLVPLIVSWVISLVIPNFQPFRLLLILPAFYLILAMGTPSFVRLCRTSAGKGIIITLILIINFVSLSVYFFNPYFWREDWKGLVRYLTAQKDSTVILPSSASNWPIKYYDTERKINLISGINGVGEIGPASPKTASRGGEMWRKSVYYIRYLAPLFDPNELILANLEKQGYAKIREISFNQIPMWEFARAEAR